MEIASLLLDGALVLGQAEQVRRRAVATCAWSNELARTARVLRHLPIPSIEGGSETSRLDDANGRGFVDSSAWAYCRVTNGG